MTLHSEHGDPYSLGEKLGAGGEATIFAVRGHGDLAAKVYTAPQSPQRPAKIRSMVANPPQDPTTGIGHVSICWPRTLLFDQAHKCVGFLMHRVDFSSNVPVLHLYNPQDRRTVAPEVSWLHLIRVSANIASVVEAIHACGYVIGDINESNFLVSQRALVTLVDCDSIQVPVVGGSGFFRCAVGKPDFTPPELQGTDFGRVDRALTHDHFALGVLIFHLLMEGVHPYAGRWLGKGDAPGIEERISKGHSPYAGSPAMVPMPSAPPFDLLPAALRSLVARCFGQGHHDHSVRPKAHEWVVALRDLETGLQTCSNNPRHVYSDHLAACPWCTRTALLGGLDPFPAKPGQQQTLAATPLANTRPARHTSPTTHRTPPRVQRTPPPLAATRGRHLPLLIGVALASVLSFAVVGQAVDAKRAADAAAVEQAAAQAELARRRHANGIVEHQRVERDVIGKWSGRLTLGGMCSPAGEPRGATNAHLTVTNEDSTFRATLLVRLFDVVTGYECGAVQVVYEASLVDVSGSSTDSTFLVLRPVRQTGDAGWRNAVYYNSMYLVPGEDGILAAHIPNLTRMQLRQSSSVENDSAGRLAEYFKTLPLNPPEFVPERDMRLYDAIGDFTWDVLRMADVRAQQLHLYDEGPVVEWLGMEFRHIIISGPDYGLRKAWMRWD